MQIGFIGLGIMGGSMALNLLKAGYQVVVYNRSPEKAEPLKPYGAEVGESPKGIAGQSDILITMLGDPTAVENMASGENGFLDNLPEGSLWVDSTTVNPGFAKAMSQEAGKRGIEYLDAPVLGSRKPAENGELMFVVGGDPSEVEKAKPLFDVMGKRVSHVGEAGKGAAMKMVFNHQLGHAMAAFAEAIKLGTAMGLDEDELMDNLTGGPVTAPFLESKKEKLKAGDVSPDFPLKWMQKDLQLAGNAAYEANVTAFLGNTAKDLYQLAKENGWSDQDFSAIYAYFQDWPNDTSS